MVDILFQSSVRDWKQTFLVDVHRACGAIEEKLSYCLPC